MSNLILGLDPGGKKDRAYGWAVCSDTENLPLQVIDTGRAAYFEEAVKAAKEVSQGPFRAVGIDSPLFWSRHIDRRVDNLLRDAYDPGSKGSKSTVKHVNSLQGACLVQGMMAAIRLREENSSIIVSECHPKVLRQLLADRYHDYLSQILADLPSDHEFDALSACVSAWAAIHQPDDWHDLTVDEPPFFSPINPVSYWMPQIDPES